MNGCFNKGLGWAKARTLAAGTKRDVVELTCFHPVRPGSRPCIDTDVSWALKGSVMEASFTGHTEFLAEGSSVSEALRTHDWSASPLDRPETWPAGLRTTVGLILSAKAQIVLFWGPDFIALYNDAYARPSATSTHGP
jgi:hypothetical protein